MNLPYDTEALTWEPGMRPELELWGDWHASTARSSGFSELREPPPPPTPDEPRVYEAYQAALARLPEVGGRRHRREHS